ncbi:hypothetical protein BJX65DRAFT_279527 [Aspergillus insuetus]
MTKTTVETGSKTQDFALSPESYLQPATGIVKEILTFKLYLCVEPITAQDINDSVMQTRADFEKRQHTTLKFKNGPPRLYKRTFGFWVDPVGMLRYGFGSVRNVCQDYSVAIVDFEEGAGFNLGDGGPGVSGVGGWIVIVSRVY